MRHSLIFVSLCRKWKSISRQQQWWWIAAKSHCLIWSGAIYHKEQYTSDSSARRACCTAMCRQMESICHGTCFYLFDVFFFKFCLGHHYIHYSCKGKCDVYRFDMIIITSAILSFLPS